MYRYAYRITSKPEADAQRCMRVSTTYYRVDVSCDVPLSWRRVGGRQHHVGLLSAPLLPARWRLSPAAVYLSASVHDEELAAETPPQRRRPRNGNLLNISVTVFGCGRKQRSGNWQCTHPRLSSWLLIRKCLQLQINNKTYLLAGHDKESYSYNFMRLESDSHSHNNTIRTKMHNASS